MLHSINSLPPCSLFSLPPHPLNHTSLSFFYCRKDAATNRPILAQLRSDSQPWLAQVPEPSTTAAPELEEGPVEIPLDFPSIFATDDNPTPLQVSTSVLLTGAVAVFLFRSIRRRAKRAKELQFRSTGAKKTLKDEALESLKAIGSISVEPKSEPSAAQALLGGLTAGVIALILYKFTTTIEASLNRQTLSDNFSVRQITITIRTIINGICYLATFVFGFNAIGLFLYSGQLGFADLLKGPEGKDGQQPTSPAASEKQTDAEDISSSERDQSADKR